MKLEEARDPRVMQRQRDVTTALAGSAAGTHFQEITMEDTRTYLREDEEPRDEEGSDWNAAPSGDEVPFHIPRD